MPKDINLIPVAKRAKLRGEANTFLKILRVVAGICITVVVLSGLAITFLKVTSRLPALQQEEFQLESQFAALSPKTAKYLFVLNRLEKFNSVTKNRIRYDERISLLLDFLPPDVTLDEIEVADSEIRATYKSQSLEEISSLVENVKKSIEINKKFVLATTANVSFAESRYSVTFILKPYEQKN